jgi:DNA-damage-inducible protein J
LTYHANELQIRKKENIMPQNQLVQARVDGAIKAQAAAALAEIGLTVSDAVRILLTRVAREKMMPLDLMTPNTETLAAMEEAKSGNLPRFDSIQALMDDLHAED